MELTDINEIRALLARHGFRFSKALGQNFLTDSRIPKAIADSAEVDKSTGVLEIGPGIGCLTKELALRAGKVVAVELDSSLKPVLGETLAGLDNVELVFGDILKQDIPALVRERFQGLRPAVCANLPYNVTSPVLTALIESRAFDTITVMVQREVARRICAEANTASYGAFTLLVQWYMQPEILFDVPPGCFVPQPKVTSSVVHMTRRAAPPAEAKNEELFFKTVRAAFNQRRKTLSNALSAGLGMDKAELERVITACGFDARVRGEALSARDFAALSNEIFALYEI